MPIKNREYEVKLAMFEGPLDLLLYLVTKAEISIIDLPVAQITTQYLEYLDLMRELNIDIAADYLHMAATLTYLKARELPPPYFTTNYFPPVEVNSIFKSLVDPLMVTVSPEVFQSPYLTGACHFWVVESFDKTMAG